MNKTTTPFTRSQHDAIAGALMNLRGEGSMRAHRQMLNWVTDSLAAMLADNSRAFDPDRFAREAGRPTRQGARS